MASNDTGFALQRAEVGMQRVWRDLRFALRALAKSPAFALTAILGLGFGLAVSSVLFSAVNAYLFRPLPVRRGGDIVALGVRKPTFGTLRNLSYPNLIDIRDDVQSFEALFAYSPFTAAVRVDSLAEHRNGQIVTGNFLQVLGIRPEAGRLLVADDDLPAANPVVVVGYTFWKSQLDGDPKVVGRALMLNGSPFVVVGVAAEGFRGIDALLAADVWVPAEQADRAGGGTGNRDGNGFRVRGYLKPGVSRSQAQAEIETLAARLRERYPVENAGLRIQVLPEKRTRPLIDVTSLAPVVGSMVIGLGLVVLINACGSVMGLTLARSIERQREVAVRRALGASTRQVLWENVLESLLIALGAGLVAWIAVGWIADAVSAGLSASSDYRFDLQPDITVLAFTIFVAGASGVAIGVVPALAAIRTDIRSVLGGGRGASPGRTRLRARIVMVQFAVVTVLLVTAGLFAESATAAKETELGFSQEDRLLVPVSPGDNGYDESRGRRIVEEVLARARAIPGVRAATAVRDVPLGPSSSSFEVRAEGQGPNADARRVAYNVVAPNYFEAMGIPIVRGRTFDSPAAGSPVVVNETLAALYWPGADPIGHGLTIAREGGETARYDVVGVARDAKYNSMNEGRRPYIYLPYSQNYRSEMTLVLYAPGNVAAIPDTVRNIVRQVEPALTPTDITTLEASIDANAMGTVRFTTAVLSAFGIVGTALAVFGMFGLLSYTMQLQKRDIGIRMALGATNARVMQHALGWSVGLAVRGVAAGLLGSVLVATLLERSIFGVGSLGSSPFLIVPVVLAGVAMLAGYLPIRHVLADDPMRALGQD
jgi:predicted permease